MGTADARAARPARATDRWERARSPALSLGSQLLNAGTNVVTTYVASLLLVPTEFGRFVVAFAAVSLALGAGRGLIGSTVMVHLPAQDPADRPRLVRSALGFTTLAGLGASVLVGLIGFAEPVLWLFAPWVTVALWQDLGRYVLLASGRPGRALALDVVWALAQALVLGVGWLVGPVTLGLVACAWGLGALAGAVLAGLLLRVAPAGAALWVRATRDVAGWFTGISVLGQVEVYSILLLTGLLLSASDVGGVRVVQLMVYQPPMVLLAALIVLMQPVVVRARGSARALHRAWRNAVLAVVPLIAVLAVLALFRGPLIGLLFPHYVGYALLVVPTVLQSVFVALGVGPLTILTGLRRGAAAFRTQLLRCVLLAAAAAAGMRTGGAPGLAWALAGASAVACTQLWVAASRAVRRATPVDGDEQVVPVAPTGQDVTPRRHHLHVR